MAEKHVAPTTTPVGADGHAVPRYMLGHDAISHTAHTLEIPASHPGHGKVVAPTTVAVGSDGTAVPRYMQGHEAVDHHSRTLEIPASHPVRNRARRRAASRRAALAASARPSYAVACSRSRHLRAPLSRVRFQ